jgi:16S rRNA processing protein RimM
VSNKQARQGANETGDFITLARVVKTQGRKGEVAAEVHSDIPDRFAIGMKLFALSRENARRELEIEELWPHKGLLVFKFAGVDSMNDAEALTGSELQVPSADRPQLEDGSTYVSDLIGCTVFDHGHKIGRIADVQFGAGEAPLLVVVNEREGGKAANYDIPFAEAYLQSVDAERREVRLKLPEGMLEVNAPVTAEEKTEQSKRQKKH